MAILRVWVVPSKSLKLLPMLGVPSLLSFRAESSDVRFGLSGPDPPRLCPATPWLITGFVELALESLVWLTSPLPRPGLRVTFLASLRRVADGSVVADVRGMKAGSSSSSSSSSERLRLSL
jgi:hypothetical protein